MSSHVLFSFCISFAVIAAFYCMSTGWNPFTLWNFEKDIIWVIECDQNPYWCGALLKVGALSLFRAGVFWTMKWSLQVSLVLATLWWIVLQNEGKTLPQPTEQEVFLSLPAVLWQVEVWQSASPLPHALDHHFLISAIWSHSVLCRELNRNRIRQVEGLTFQSLSNLEVLKLQRNSISKLTDGAFWGLASMKTLYVKNIYFFCCACCILIWHF